MLAIDKVSTATERLIDDKVGSVADGIESAARSLRQAVPQDAVGLGNLADPAAERLSGIAENLRQTDGQAIVEQMKQQIIRHPVATVALSASVAAIGAQFLVGALRSQQKAAPELERVA